MKVTFLPQNVTGEALEGTKLLVVARKLKLPIRFGCASCRCGTCGVKVTRGAASPMSPEEKELLEKMKLSVDGSIRLSCQARVAKEDLTIDLDFQNEYSPDTGLG